MAYPFLHGIQHSELYPLYRQFPSIKNGGIRDPAFGIWQKKKQQHLCRMTPFLLLLFCRCRMPNAVFAVCSVGVSRYTPQHRIGGQSMHTSDTQLVAYLAICDPVELHTIIAMMRSKLSPKSKELAKKFATVESIPAVGTAERNALARSAADLLRWFGSNSISYGLRRLVKRHGGASYHRIVADVARHINHKRSDRATLPRMATVSEWEEVIVRTLLVGALKDRPTAEVAEMLHGAGLKADAAMATAIQFGPRAAGVALPLLLKGLGGKVAGTLLEQLMVGLAFRYVGKEAAEVVAKRLAVGLATRSWTRFISFVGWALVGIDILKFATSPAARITVPTVAAISVFRVRSRLVGGVPEIIAPAEPRGLLTEPKEKFLQP
jgi:hypothetical protein